MILSLFNLVTALVPLMLSLLLVHLYIPLWKSTTALSTMPPHLVSGMNVLWNFANLLMISPCHCHLILLTSVHHLHHHHHFHCVSLLLSSTPDSKRNFSINPFYHSLPHLFGLIWSVFVLFSLFLAFLFDSCDRLSWFNWLFNCTLNLSTFLYFNTVGHNVIRAVSGQDTDWNRRGTTRLDEQRNAKDSGKGKEKERGEFALLLVPVLLLTFRSSLFRVYNSVASQL